MNEKWPKSWSEIYNTETSGIASFDKQYIELGQGIRSFKGTLYVSVTIGSHEKDVKDDWMPFDRYIQRQIKES